MEPTLESMKKSYARVLACVVASGQEGIWLPSLLLRLEEKYNERCDLTTARKILEALAFINFVRYDTTTEEWVCTDNGRREYETIMQKEPERLERKTTSPQVPMHA